ncbi:Transmembrane emp24 domain-containing protein 10, partial [Varanus komodoensis]
LPTEPRIDLPRAVTQEAAGHVPPAGGGDKAPGLVSVGSAAMLLLSVPGGRFHLRPAFPPLLTLLLLVLLPGPARPISFQLPGKARKCLREEIHRDTLVTGEYEVAPPPGSSSGPSANLKITDSAGHILYSKEDATKGKFAFTTEDYDMFEACFESKLPVGDIPVKASKRNRADARPARDLEYEAWSGSKKLRGGTSLLFLPMSLIFFLAIIPAFSASVSDFLPSNHMA